MAILLIWLVLWQLASAAIHNKIIFVGPWETACALVSQVQTAEFWRTILASFLRIAGGFLAAFLLGILAAALAGRYALLREFLEPPVDLLQSVPVASFVILALIWIGSENLSVLITLLVVFPVIYRNVLEGIRQTDPKLLEMARVFRMKKRNRLWYIYRPDLMPYLLAGSRISLGMAWKSGVAAEVIGVPDCSIGEKLYMAKIYLSTAELFAWTFVIIVVSRLFEWLFLSGLRWLSRDLVQTSGADKKQAADVNRKNVHSGIANSDFAEITKMPDQAQQPVRIEKIRKAYHDNPVLTGENLVLEPGGKYCLMGASGQGKTTLLRLMMGLENPDGGTIRGIEEKRISIVFQEDRLCEYLDSVDNCRIACGKPGLFLEPEGLCRELLGEEAAHRPVRELSGGMKRRAAVARALAVRSDLLLMDEPFTGLDEETKKQVIRIVGENLQGRTLLAVTHQRQDAELLGAQVLQMKGQT